MPCLQRGKKVHFSNGLVYKYIQINEMQMKSVISEGRPSRGDKKCVLRGKTSQT